MKRLFNNSFLRGSAITTFFGLAVGLINYLFNFLNARFLGPVGYGEVSAFFSYVAILSIPVSILSVYIMQKISARGTEKDIFAASIIHLFWQKMRRWYFILLLSLLVIPFIPTLTNLSLLSSLMLIPIVLIALVTALYTGSNQGMRLFLPAALALLLSTVLKLPGPFTSSFAGVMLFVFLSYLAGFFGQRFVLSRHIKLTHKPTQLLEHRIIHILTRPEFIAVALSVISGVLIANVDIIFVKKFMSPLEAGLYSSWTVCSRILYYVMGPLISVGFLFFSNSKDKKEQKNTLFLSLFILILASVGYFFLFDQQGTFVIHLMFGQKFNSMIPYLHQAAMYGVGYLFMQFFATYFLAQKGKMAYVFPAGLIFYIISLFLFGHTLASIMMVNIAFSFTIVGVYLASFLFSSA